MMEAPCISENSATFPITTWCNNSRKELTSRRNLKSTSNKKTSGHELTKYRFREAASFHIRRSLLV
jgi:hypothetical protein